MVYDCFTFYNELDILEIRLNTLYPIVDYFVIVEATKSFSGNEKPLYYNMNSNRYDEFKEKIIHIIVDDFPETNNSWIRESYQRNAILRGLYKCTTEDIVIISDVDEIPRPEKLLEYLTADNKTEVVNFVCDNFSYYYNYINIRSPRWFVGPKLVRYKKFTQQLDPKSFEYSSSLPFEQNKGTTPTKLRLSKAANNVANGGWHFSYLGGQKSILEKCKAISNHGGKQERVTRTLSENSIKEIISKGKDLYGKWYFTRYKAVYLGTQFPEYILSNREKFEEYIYPKNINIFDKIELFLFRNGLDEVRNSLITIALKGLNSIKLRRKIG